jgi:hypothetical protein
VESIEYRNLAPLYCDEPMRLCGRVKKTLDDGELYDVWIEGLTGGVAVKGTVRAIRIVHAKEPTPASVLKPQTFGPLHPGLRIRKISTDAGGLISTTSPTSLKGSRRVEILGHMENAPATPALEDGQTPGTAEDTAASVRRPIRSVASIAPNPQPRAGDQQETKSRDTGAVDRPKLRLSTFYIPPASPQLEAPPSEAQTSPMLRADSSDTSQSSDRVPHARLTRIIPSTGPIVRKYAGAPYVYNPTDVAERHSRYKRSGILKVSQHSIRYRTEPEETTNSRLSPWQKI